MFTKKVDKQLKIIRIDFIYKNIKIIIDLL
jgi:hypothetical protein